MTVLIVEYIPYVAFTAAAGLVAWVSFDVLRARFARPRVLAPDAAQDSGRGLAGPAIPLSARAPLVAEVVPEAEPVVVAEIEPEPAVEAAVEPELPVSQAVNVAEEPAEEPAAEVAEELPIAVEADVITVRRDPSVRVFDTAVAASERKVLSTGD